MNPLTKGLLVATPIAVVLWAVIALVLARAGGLI